MSKIVIIGSKGQVGTEFQTLSAFFPEFDFLFYDKDELDIQIKEDVDGMMEEIEPDVLVNCAAYTAVDKAETEKEMAYAINSEAVGFMAAACIRKNTRFIHIS